MSHDHTTGSALPLRVSESSGAAAEICASHGTRTRSPWTALPSTEPVQSSCRTVQYLSLCIHSTFSLQQLSSSYFCNGPYSCISAQHYLEHPKTSFFIFTFRNCFIYSALLKSSFLTLVLDFHWTSSQIVLNTLLFWFLSLCKSSYHSFMPNFHFSSPLTP